MLDDRGIVINWLVKVAVAFIIVGLILFEIGAVVIVRTTAGETASKAATEAGFRYRDTGDVNRAADVAREYVESQGAEFISYSVDPEGTTSTVSVRKRAKTIFLQRIEPLKKYTVATATESSPIGH
jgi:hypothetical protein